MENRFAIEGVGAATPVAEAAERILLAKAAPLFALEAAAAGGQDPDAVHDMRVASRRLREALQLFAPVYRRKMPDAWYPVVSDVTKTLGRVRDGDVFIDTFHRLIRSATDPAERTALAYLIGRRQAERAADLARMRKRLGGLGLAGAQRRFAKAVGLPKDSEATRRPLGELAEEAVATRLAAMYGYLPAALTAEDAPSQHAMRIACKKLRYAVETFAPSFGEGFAGVHDTLVEFQDVLGELHDHDVFIAGVIAVRDGGEAAAAGVTRHGLDEVVAGLRARRERLFGRFEKLCGVWPEEAMRERLLAALPAPGTAAP